MLDDIRTSVIYDYTIAQFYFGLSVDPTVVGAIQENRLTQISPDPAICYYLANKESELDLSGNPMLTTYQVDIEVHSADPANADTLADLLRAKFHGYQADALFYQFTTSTTPQTQAVYVRQGFYNSQPYYFSPTTSYYLFWDSTGHQWWLTTALGTLTGWTTSSGSILGGYLNSGSQLTTPVAGSFIRSCFVSDYDESYQPKGNYGDDLVNINSLRLDITST